MIETKMKTDNEETGIDGVDITSIAFSSFLQFIGCATNSTLPETNIIYIHIAPEN